MRNLQYCFFILLAIFLASCVAVQPFPYAVRAGDTITLAIGSLDNVNKDDMSITYYPDPDSQPSDNPVDVTSGIRSVFNIFPDKKSKSYWDTTSGLGLETISSVENFSGHSAWQTVVAVDLPPTLPIGTGHFIVSPGASVIYPSFLTRAESVDINAQILEPGGEAHAFEYRKFNFNNNTNIGILAELGQLRQVVLRHIPANNDSPIPIAAAEYNLQVPIIDVSMNDVSDLVPNSDITVILDDQVNYLKNQSSLNWGRSGASIKVVTTSLSGNQNANLLRFVIILSNYADAEANGWSLADNASLVTVKYYNVDGDEISGPIPEVVVQ